MESLLETTSSSFRQHDFKQMQKLSPLTVIQNSFNLEINDLRTVSARRLLLILLYSLSFFKIKQIVDCYYFQYPRNSQPQPFNHVEGEVHINIRG